MNLNDLLVPSNVNFASFYESGEYEMKVLAADAYLDDVLADMNPETRKHYPKLPWPRTHADFEFRPGEVTLVAGSNGVGKSYITGMMGVCLAAQDVKSCFASFEMKPRKTLSRMLRQAARTSAPTPEKARKVLEWLGGRMWLYDQQGTVSTKTVLGMIKWCAEKLGIQVFFVDSLMKCMKNEDDYNEQKIFVDQLCGLARDLGVHVVLVHHIRKLADEKNIPNKHDIKGSGSITDQVDNVFIAWRNKPKEIAIKDGKDYDASEPDALLILDKQRNGDVEDRYGLWVHRDSFQFTSEEGSCMNLFISPDGVIADV